MKNGIIFLEPIYKLICEQYKKEFPEQNPWNNKSNIWKAYRSCYKKICERLPESPGFYLFGNYDQKTKYWSNIYIGMAGTNKTASLFNRISKEMTAESAFAFGQIMDIDKINDFTKKAYRNKYKEYVKHNERAIRKKGTTHIIWCDTHLKDDSEIKDVEKDLIEIFNPKANVKKPAPPKELHSHSIEVLNAMRLLIHENRNTAFKIIKK